VTDAYWLASAFWYSSLVLSILGILLASQQTTVLQLLGRPPTNTLGGYAEKNDVRRFLPLILTKVRPRILQDTESVDDGYHLGQWRPRWKMVFIWQCPIMFMSYSVCFFLAGLTLFVCTPLIRGDNWSTASNVNISFLIMFSYERTNKLTDSGDISSYRRNRRWNICLCFVLDISLCGSRPYRDYGRE